MIGLCGGMTFTLDRFDLDAFVAATLAEDLGAPYGEGGRDVTSEAVIPADAIFSGVMDSRHAAVIRSEEHTSELQSRSDLVCRLLLEKKKDRFQHKTKGERQQRYITT